jgi:biotin transport system substrate-specific component
MRNAATIPAHHGATFLDATLDASDRGVARSIRPAAVVFVTVLTAAASQISIPLPFTPVPFTFQPVIVLLGAAVLGPRLGACSQILYLAAGIAGLPVFAASPGLPQAAARLLGPTGGYLLAYPAAAYLTGWLAAKGFDRQYRTAVLAMLLGLAVIFSGGAMWLTWLTRDLRTAFNLGVTPFVVADVLKIGVAAALLPSAWKLTGFGARVG